MSLSRQLVSGSAFALAVGCTIPINWPQHRVLVHIDNGAPGVLQTVTDSGCDIEVTNLRYGVESVELIACDTIDERRRDLPGFAEILTPNAFAHGVSSSTKNATPIVVGGLNGSTTTIAELSPPVDEYCAIEVQLGPADVDAPGLAAADDDMVGSTLRAAGRFRTETDDEWTPFQWNSGARATATFHLKERLNLGDETVEARYEITSNIVRWFADADCAGADEDVAYHLLENAVAAVEIEENAR